MHLKPENLPVSMEAPGTKMHLQTGWGDMAVAYWKMQTVDSRPMLKGLPHDSCPCPHRGYVLKGSMQIIYDDRETETVSEGNVFYLPAVHNAVSSDEIIWIEFSPEKELQIVFEHLAKK
jgi:hypothetical protein